MTEREKRAQGRLAGNTWSGLEPMILEYAAEAVAIAKAEFHEELDWTAASLDRLERILNRLCPAPDPLPADGSEWLTLLWGSYLGELFRHLHGGEWAMTIYPGSEYAVPTLELAGGSRLYPTVKVHRRLSLGATESIPAFAAMIRARMPETGTRAE